MIVSGTDFSENAAQANLAAAAIARRLSVPLKLVHVIDEIGAELAIASDRGSVYDPLRKRLRDQAVEMGMRFGIDVEPIFVSGFPYRKLIEIAQTHSARLIVLSSLGETKQHQWLLGSVAERVAQSSPIPVLIVRDAASIQAWANGDRALRAMVGVEIGSTSKAALRWAADLRAIGQCKLVVAHVAWPIGEHTRLGIPSPIPLDRLRPEIHDVLMRDLRAWAGDVPGEEATFTISPGWGRVDTHLSLLAADEKADLLVVGAHQRASIARLWQGSVSRGVLHHASCNVACVPRGPTAEGQDVVMPTFRRVLIPTDFSPLANRAIPVGYGLVAPGGIVRLLHVVTRKPGEDDPDVTERLRALIPSGAAAKGVTTEVEVIPEENAWIGIWQAAGRSGVDAICMATHGRSAVLQSVFGSQAQEVLQRAQQPVILVPPERED